VEVILHVRRADLEWFNSNGEEHLQEILHLLSDSMVPRMCYDEVEHYHHKKDPLRFPKDEDDKIGEKNNGPAKPVKKRKRGSKKQAAAAAAAAAAAVVGQAQEDNAEEKTQKVNNVYYAFGESLYCAYKTEELNSAGSATLVFKRKDDNGTEDASDKAKQKEGKLGGGDFMQLKKLSKRFILYCFKIDPNDPGAPDPPDAGYIGT
jgi:hypothetical protein